MVRTKIWTRTESVTPFIVGWVGALSLVPESDSWVDPVRLEANIVQTEGNFAETLEEQQELLMLILKQGLPTLEHLG